MLQAITRFEVVLDLGQGRLPCGHKTPRAYYVIVDDAVRLMCARCILKHFTDEDDRENVKVALKAMEYGRDGGKRHQILVEQLKRFLRDSDSAAFGYAVGQYERYGQNAYHRIRQTMGTYR